MQQKTIPVNVRIFGKEYTVACPEGEEQGLLGSARKVDEEMQRIRQSGKVVGTERIAVIVALNLAYELMLSQKTAPDGSVDAKSLQRMQQLQQNIDSVLKDYQQEYPQ